MKFNLNWLTSLEAMTDVLGVHFLSGHRAQAQQAQAPLLTCQNRIEIKSKNENKMIYAKRLSE